MSNSIKGNLDVRILTREDLIVRFKSERDAAYAKIRELEKTVKILELEKELAQYKNSRDRS